MKKKIFSCISLLLALCLLLGSCGAGAGAPALLTVVKDTVSGFFTNATNLLQKNKPVVLDGELLLHPTYSPACAEQANAALARICEKTGLAEIKTTSAPDAPKLRMDLGLKEGLTAAEYFIGFDGADLIITATNVPVLQEAVRYFERTYVTGPDANVGQGYLFLPGDLAYTSPTLALIDEQGDALYSICYPEGADTAAFNSIALLRDAVKNAAGVTLNLQSDFIATESTTENKEILVGLTNRAESVAAASEVGYDSYYIGITEHKIVIMAQNAFMLQKAINAFTELFLLGENAAASRDPAAVALPTALSYRQSEDLLLFAKDYRTDYTLIYPAGIHATALSFIREFQLNVEWLTGASIPAYTDTERPVSNLSGGNREILLGNTNRSSATAAATPNWRIYADGTDIKIEAGSVNHYQFALESLFLLIQDQARKQNTVNDKDYNARYPLVCLDAALDLQGSDAPDINSFTGIIDIGESAYMLYRDNSSVNDYNGYLQKVSGANYKLHTSGKAGSVYSAPYYSDDEILNITFTDADSVLRVAVDPRSESELHPLTETPHNGKSGVEPLFIQLGGMSTLYRSMDCGMSYVLRLTDGTFIVVDGGGGDDVIAENLLSTLKRENKLSGKPVIACWIFTHAHSDHVGAFRTFTNEHADEVTLQSVLYSFPAEEQSYIHGGSGVVAVQRTFRNYLAEYGRPTVYKARTGQKLQFTNCEIEMLFTYEDYTQPKYLTYFNDSSIVFRATLSDGVNEQTMMMLGDCSEASAPILVARYGDYLQSDAVQVAHHGYAGGTADLYDAIAAPIVFWPCPLYDPKDGVDVDKRFNNPKWSKVTRVMLGQDYAEILYVAGYGDVTLTLEELVGRVIKGIGCTAESAKYPS